MDVLDYNGLSLYDENIKNYIQKHTQYEETDPTVPAWAKEANKPTYTAAEVGALPSDTVIPTKVSELDNDSNFISTETDPTVPAHVKAITAQNIIDWNTKSAFSGSYNDLTDKPTDVSAFNNDAGYITEAATPVQGAKADTAVQSVKIGTTEYKSGTNVVLPAYPDEDTVSGWGFSKTTGTYNKPSTGIPKTDLSNDVQASLGKADTALQSHQSLSGVVPKTTTVNNKALSENITLTASDVGAHANTVTHLSGDIATSEKGAANGVATLGSDGKIPSSQLPSYVDDVLEYSAKASFPTTGESGKIYVDLTTNKTWRWSGSAYVEISPSIVVGTTTGTAFDGKVGNDHVTNTSNPHGVTKAQVGLGNVDNKSSATIRSEITKDNVTTALGYTPPTTNTTYGTVTTAAAGLMTADDKKKLNGIAVGANAYSLPDATSSVKGGVIVGSNITVSSGTISLTKANVTSALGYTPPTTDTNTTYAAVTTAVNGLMSSADKKKLDGIAAGANAYSLPDATSSVKGGVKVGSNITVSSGTISLTKANVTAALGYTPPTTDTNTTYAAVTTAANGLMTKDDKIKLNGIAAGANAYSLPLAASGTRGGVKIGYTANGKNYPVQLSNEQMYVNVPWTDNNTTYAVATTAAAGLLRQLNGSTANYLRGDGTWQTPPNTDTKNTAGSTDTSSKIFLVGATSQAANPQTYSDNEVYVTNGVLTTKSVQVGGTKATMQYNTTNECIDFVFS